MRTKINRTHSILVAALLGLGLAGCVQGPESEVAQAEEKDNTPAIPVEVAEITLGDVAAVYTGTATLEAEEEATVVAKVGGEIKAIHVEEGDRVKAGDLLAKIDDERLRYEVARSRAALGKLEQEYNRNKSLHDRDLVSSDAFERLKYDLAAARAALDLAELNLEWTEVRAPIDGIVSLRSIKVGNVIQNNEAAFRITDFDPLLARLDVPERELNKLRVGQTAAVGVDALPGQYFEAVIDRISPVVDASTGTFKVTLEVRDLGDTLKPGMFGRVQVVYDQRNGTLLAPRNAIITEDQRAAVFVVEDGVAQRKSVKTGYVNNGQIEIVEGVNLGDRIVTVGHSSLKDGAKVDVINLDGTQGQVNAETTMANSN